MGDEVVGDSVGCLGEGVFGDVPYGDWGYSVSWARRGLSVSCRQPSWRKELSPTLKTPKLENGNPGEPDC